MYRVCPQREQGVTGEPLPIGIAPFGDNPLKIDLGKLFPACVQMKFPGLIQQLVPFG